MAVKTRGAGTGIPTADEIKRSPEIFRRRIAHAARATAAKRALWRNCWNMYHSGSARYTENGHWRLPGTDDILIDGMITIGHAKARVDDMLTQALLIDPRIAAKAVIRKDAIPAMLMGRYLNQVWRQYKMREPTNLAGTDMAVTGHGWLKIWWQRRTNAAEATETAYRREAARLDAELRSFVENNPELAGDLPAAADIETGLREHAAAVGAARAEVIESRPRLWHVDQFDMFVAPTARSIGDAQWIAHRQYRNVADVRADDDYAADARREVTAQSRTDPGLAGTETAWTDSITGEPGEHRQVAVWEYWSLEDNLFAVFADGSDKWLVRPGPLPATRPPFIYLQQDPTGDRFYPSGGIAPMLHLCEAINAGATTMLLHRARAVAKYAIRAEHATDEVKKGLQSGMPGKVIAFDQVAQTPLSDFVEILQPPEMPKDLWLMDSYLERAFNAVAGGRPISEEKIPVEKTAAEVTIAAQQTQTRAQRTTAALEEAVTEICRTVAAFAQTNLEGSVELIPEIHAGRVEQLPIPAVTREMLRGDREFLYEITAGSMSARDDREKREKALLTAQAMTPFVTLGVVDPYQLALEVAAGIGVADAARLVKPGPGPGAEPGPGPADVSPGGRGGAIVGPMTGAPGQPAADDIAAAL